MVRVKDTVNHQICKGKEQAGDAARVLLKLVPEQERIKHQPGVRQSVLGKALLRGHAARVRPPCLSHGREERVVVRAIGGAEGVFDIGGRRGRGFRTISDKLGRTWNRFWVIESEVASRRVRKVLVHCDGIMLSAG